MKRPVVSLVVGAILGGILFFPPAVPIAFTLTFGLSHFPQLTYVEFVVLPVIGMFIGAMVGSRIGAKKRSFALFNRKSCSPLFWCIGIFSLVGLEVGFILSPVTLVGLGNTSTWIDLWLFSLGFGIAGMVVGVGVGLIVLMAFESY